MVPINRFSSRMAFLPSESARSTVLYAASFLHSPTLPELQLFSTVFP